MAIVENGPSSPMAKLWHGQTVTTDIQVKSYETLSLKKNMNNENRV